MPELSRRRSDDRRSVICFRIERMQWRPAYNRREANCHRPKRLARGYCDGRYVTAQPIKRMVDAGAGTALSPPLSS
jgi:hypothetical protein